ncbi:SpoIVB peptidase [Thermohalobacter berrensis]|uniref:SpoIVB peptidase n=1 Tax=Thermohalobacter berrensis TaxID=99594 RepID=A0A419TB97_9FIRM|nr:SpoIVB peptidase [Thermohalobacter berrensis]RKD34774.1 SpoIVB peptidase [Thermohalobacter berrensis]
MAKSSKGKKLTILLAILAISLALGIQTYTLIHFPSQIDIFKGETRKINVIFPFSIDVLQNKNNILVVDSHELGLNVNNYYEFKTLSKGTATLELKLLNFIPIRDIKVNVIDKRYLVPGGHSIGVKLNTKGVLVVALSDITGLDGQKYNPAKNAGIRVGDIILEINGIKVRSADHVIELLNKFKGKKLKLKIERNKKEFILETRPVKSKKDNLYKLGVWVRDRTAGIGTLTFYDKKTNKFGALGHGITDMDTGYLMPTKNGEILKATVSSIQQGQKGNPGELRGIFFESKNKLGKIEKNTRYGIYGICYKDIKNKRIGKPIPVGLRSEVHQGKAYILTTIDKNTIEKFQVEIVKVQPQLVQQQKSMVIKVVDKKLLEKTGGIVQGMSGSPIIQNGKLIGAVTHVFVNDPTKGYGLYIEWMLKEAGINLKSKDEFAKAN